MPRVIMNGTVIAESSDTKVVEGNHYFPPEAVKSDYFTETSHSTNCPWKGKASYYTISVDGETAENAAWVYPQPKDAAAEIKDHIAFYKGKVTIEG